jgi:ubiquinone biosynthesis accessory factor UbiJ
MNTSSPFSLPFTFPPNLQSLPAWLQPPGWLVREVQQRVVLALNHVLQQEPEAMARLARQKGRVAHINAAQIAIELIATPAGLLDLAPAGSKAHLTLTVTDSNPLSLLQTTLKGEKPAIQVQGDVQLAAEVNWLVDHVRWDAEEDLSRILGDAPAHGLMQVLRQAGETLKKFAPNPAATAASASKSTPTSASTASPATMPAPTSAAGYKPPPDNGPATGVSG